MDIVRLKGGLGNQMFQYALVEALRARGREVGCNLSFYRRHPDAMPFCLNEVFSRIILNEAEDEVFDDVIKKWKEIKKNQNELSKFLTDTPNRFFWGEDLKETGCYNEQVFQTTSCTFTGYWQTEKYFKNIEDRIRYVYTFTNVNEELEQFAEQLKNHYYSIHVRRNDYIGCSTYENICTKEYYIKAINYVCNKDNKAKFIFFSDDIEWVQHNLYIENAMYNRKDMFENYQDWFDMYLMSKCYGNIIAHSSFSWWGAWLNDNPEKIVIAPNKWTNVCDMPDIWCDGWIKI